MQWSAKHADDVARAAGKAVAESGEGLTKVLPKWWKSVTSVAEESAEHSAEMVAKYTNRILDDMPDVIHQGLRGELGVEAEQVFAKAIDTNNKHVVNLARKIKNLDKESLGIANDISSLSERMNDIKEAVPPGDILDQSWIYNRDRELFNLQRQVDTKKRSFDSLSAELSEYQSMHNTAVDMQKALNEGNYKYVAKQLTSGRGQEYVQDVLGPGMVETIKKITRAHVSASPYLDSPRKFLEQYLIYAADPSYANTLKSFVANPLNARLLAKIKTRNPGMVKELVEKGVTRAPFKKRLLGLTFGDTAKRLGVGATSLAAGGYGALQVYDWFGKNNPAHMASESQSIVSVLNNVSTSGPGERILVLAKESVNRISSIANRTNAGLGDENPEQEVSAFIQGISTELVNISNALGQWNLVVQGSQNKKQAINAGKALEKYAYDVLKPLNELQKTLGMSPQNVNIKKAPRQQTTSTNVTDLQAALGLEQTGKIDRDTISKLQSMENELNIRKSTDEFTGSFYNPSTNQVIPLSYLNSVYKKFM